MATFVCLINLTQQGEEDIKHTVERANRFREEATKAGATVKELYWTLGSYDGVVIFDAPNDEIAASLIMGLGSRGSTQTQTLRAFNREEIQSILSRVS